MAVGIALKHPKYVNSVGGDYKFNYRRELWDKRIEPYMLQRGAGYDSFDREEFLSTGHLKPVDKHKAFEVYKEGVTSGVLDLASATSKMAHWVATVPFFDVSDGPATNERLGVKHVKTKPEQSIDKVYNNFQSWVGEKRQASDERLQEVTNNSIQDWLLHGIGTVTVQLPLWAATGAGAAALDAGLPAITATGAAGVAQTFLRKAVIDASEGLVYTAMDDPKNWKSYAIGTSQFVVMNPVMRYVGKLIGIGGHNWERKNIAAAIQHYADKDAAQGAINTAMEHGGFNPEGTAKVDQLLERGAVDAALDKPHSDPVLNTHIEILNAMAKYMHGRSGFQFLSKEQRLSVVQNFGKIFQMAMAKPIKAAPEFAIPVISKGVQEATKMTPEQAQAVAKDVMESARAQEHVAENAAQKIDAAAKAAEEAHGVQVATPTDTAKPGAASAKSLEFYNNTMQWFRDNVKEMIPGINIERGERRILAMMNLVAEGHIPMSGAEKEQFLTSGLYHLNHSTRPEYREIMSIEEAVEQGRAVWHHTKMVEANVKHPEVGKHVTKKGEVTSFGSSMPRKKDKITGTGHDIALDALDRERIHKLWDKQRGAAKGGEVHKIEAPKEKLGDIEPQREMVTDKDGNTRVKIGMDKDRGIRMTITGLYKDRGPRKQMIEMVQNAYDEVRTAIRNKLDGPHEITLITGNGDPRFDLARAPENEADFIKWYSEKYKWSGTEKEAKEEWAKQEYYVSEWKRDRGLDSAPKLPFFSIHDTGRGMTKKQLGTVFTDVYSSGKADDAGASGGWGVAKTSFQLGGEYFRADSVVREGNKIVRHIMEGTPDELLDGVPIKTEVLWRENAVNTGEKPRTGLTVTTWVPEDKSYAANYEVRDAWEKIAEHGDKNITFKSERYAQTPTDDVINMATPAKPAELGDPIQHFDFEGGKVDLYKGPVSTVAQGSVEVRLLNQGLYQGATSVHLPEPVKGLPEYITADVSATKVRPGHEKYPWTQSREELHPEIQNEIDKYVKQELFNHLSKQRKTELQAAWDSIYEHKYTKANGTEGTVHVYAESPELNAVAKDMMQSPFWTNYIEQVGAISDYFKDNFTRAGTYAKERKSEVEKVGIFLPKPNENSVTFGINVPNPGNEGKSEAIFLNPFGTQDWNLMLLHNNPETELYNTAAQHATHQFNTILHEFAHNAVRNHGVDFEGRMAEMYAFIEMEDEFQMRKNLAAAISGTSANAEKGSSNVRPSSEYAKTLQRYFKAGREEGSGGESLVRTGVSSKQPKKDRIIPSSGG